jgi:hypothetical protein
VIAMKRPKPLTLSGAVLMMGLAVLGLAACSSASGSPGTAAVPPPPRLVTAKPAAGAAGKGPLVIASPSSLPGGKTGSQQVVLSDRILVISSVSRQQGADEKTALIQLSLVLKNTGIKAIGNKPAAFELMNSGGDIFSYQVNSTDSFYGTIGAHTSHTGMIGFQVPVAATSALYLLYRPGTGMEAVLTRLTTG